MAKDLTNSVVERQNILNNHYALTKAEEHLGLGGIEFKGEYVFTKQQVMELFAISDTTVERYIVAHGEELRSNGYILLKGKNLKEFKELCNVSFINEGNKVPMLGLFNFRAVLNLAMLLTESERAKAIRSRLLDIVLDVLAERVGGKTTYINQRDEHYLLAAYQEEGYRKQFTDALDNFVEGNQYKYGRFTNLIYQSIFRENAAEYRQILNLNEHDGTRETMYSEVLTLIASYESGIAHELERESQRLGRKLTQKETTALFKTFEAHPLFKPLMLDARTKMASRDLCFRDALHQRLEAYIQSVPQGDFERFLGETSKSLEERLNDPETLAVFKRLKDR
ncbi:DNA-binding protein [Candidatus Thiothrix anitrata]|uniref:DNA-binding protein n=1 Tax=Candidatus Thiothrix anitrata TaxID=2823902 RepID=A0ABX7X4R0_9GAMM|nr:DNA-binding protein [Candidatus Thiothrix anitrata]QTR50826.1 DNA-binding protein [Candidatus Thiothrix anitrata]